MPTTITICDTCNRDGHAPRADGQTEGARLAALIEAAAEGESTVRTRRHSCLMGCGRGCNLAITARGKTSYVLGGFAPDEGSARAVLEYARKHAVSATGIVPYREWPTGVKGHFTARLPVPEEGA